VFSESRSIEAGDGRVQLPRWLIPVLALVVAVTVAVAVHSHLQNPRLSKPRLVKAYVAALNHSDANRIRKLCGQWAGDQAKISSRMASLAAAELRITHLSFLEDRDLSENWTAAVIVRGRNGDTAKTLRLRYELDKGYELYGGPDCSE
jgi:hypothetical protein